MTTVMRVTGSPNPFVHARAYGCFGNVVTVVTVVTDSASDAGRSVPEVSTNQAEAQCMTLRSASPLTLVLRSQFRLEPMNPSRVSALEFQRPRRRRDSERLARARRPNNSPGLRRERRSVMLVSRAQQGVSHD